MITFNCWILRKELTNRIEFVNLNIMEEVEEKSSKWDKIGVIQLTWIPLILWK